MERENDLVKLQLAKEHNYNYIVIDCRHSTMEWLKSNCIKSLQNFFELRDVNWDLVWEKAQTRYTKECWKLWDERFTISDISRKLNLSEVTVRKYLKLGGAIGKCSYNSIEELNKIKRKIICITTGVEYESLSLASKEYGFTLKQINRCCNSKYKRLGKLKDGRDLIWMYLDEYKLASNETIKELIEATPPQRRRVYCITTGEEFENTQKAADYYGIERRNIHYCCTGERNFCGKLEDGTPLTWKFI